MCLLEEAQGEVPCGEDVARLCHVALEPEESLMPCFILQYG